MVERGRLEICCTFRGTEGSNPSLSAIQSGLCGASPCRLTNSLRIQEVKRKTAESVANAIIKLLSLFSDRVITMTSDNGKEFAEHKKIARKLNAKFYFAHPYASWERGLNENTNGLIRQYFTKGSDFTNITQKEINRAMNKLNNRPRKCLGIKTPNQVFLGINPPVALAT